jgi:hypothetical protein
MLAAEWKIPSATRLGRKWSLDKTSRREIQVDLAVSKILNEAWMVKGGLAE